MMEGVFLVCPTGSTVTVDTNERPRCRDSLGENAWELHNTTEITNTALDPEDFDYLWGACVLFLILGFGIKVLRSTLNNNPSRG